MAKHTIISIGYLGNRRCYLDVPREEAIRRYAETEGEVPMDRIDEIEIEDEWTSYNGADLP